MAERQDAKKEYSPPKIVHSEKMAARAVICAKSDSATCGSTGPIQS